MGGGFIIDKDRFWEEGGARDFVGGLLTLLGVGVVSGQGRS